MKKNPSRSGSLRKNETKTTHALECACHDRVVIAIRPDAFLGGGIQRFRKSPEVFPELFRK